MRALAVQRGEHLDEFRHCREQEVQRVAANAPQKRMRVQ